MGREDGFKAADISVRLLDDAKVRELLRQVPDELLRLRAMVVYVATVLDSWGEGQRVAARQAAPIWVSDPDAAVAALKSVGLLDSDGLIPSQAWANWFGEAYGRRMATRERWSKAAAHRRREVATDEVANEESARSPR